MVRRGKLYLIPNIIASGTTEEVILPQIKNIIKATQYYLVEDIRSARRFISSLKVVDSIEVLHFRILNKDTRPAELNELMKPLLEGYDVGVLSESGCPGVADPGALAVAFAHQSNIKVVPLVGPSSLFLALMASGLNGQRFAFHGYLPVSKTDREKTIALLEKESRKRALTQIFIETPYRNNALFESLINVLSANTALCVAVDITGTSETIVTRPVAEWKMRKTEWPKLPAVFLFLAC
ncbi:MAG: SAM-dependent methyltransferase [Cyclobacteriaceae bacterium]